MGALQQKLKNLAAFDILGLWIIGLPGLFFGIISRDPTSFLVGLMLTALGFTARRGYILLKKRKVEAKHWLAGSQLGLLLVVTVYCLWKLLSPSDSPLSLLSPQMLELVEHLPGYDIELIEGMLPLMMRITYFLVLLISLLYQGFMVFYYWKKIPRALAVPPPLPDPITNPAG